MMTRITQIWYSGVSRSRESPDLQYSRSGLSESMRVSTTREGWLSFSDETIDSNYDTKRKQSKDTSAKGKQKSQGTFSELLHATDLRSTPRDWRNDSSIERSQDSDEDPSSKEWAQPMGDNLLDQRTIHRTILWIHFDHGTIQHRNRPYVNFPTYCITQF